MPRRPRLMLPGTPVHLIQRGNNRQPCFFSDDDFRFYLASLAEYSAAEACDIHAFVLMTNHIHLLATSDTETGIAIMMKRLGQRYTQYINRSRKRSGTLWEGRYRSCLVQNDSYLLCCYRYIELNPVRAGMVSQPGDYPWSSFRHNALGATNALITPHPSYTALSANPHHRLRVYREFVNQGPNQAQDDQLRASTNGNVVFGDAAFGDKVTKAIRQRAIPGLHGRPFKQ